MYRNKMTRQDKRAALESAILEAVYHGGTLTLREIADRVGRSKSPALRNVVADLCADGLLVSSLCEYKALGVYRFQVGHWWKISRDCQTDFFEVA
jgi:DNA-binding Lrp family transcriptional regulator